MIIAKTASRNVAFFLFAGQSGISITEVATAGASTHEEDLEDVGRKNVDLYIT